MALASILLAGHSAVAWADATDTAPFTMAIPALVDLATVSGDIAITPPALTLASFLAGYSPSKDVTFSVSSNGNWQLKIKGDGGGTWGAGGVKPVGDIEWKVGAGSYTQLSTSAVLVASGGAADGQSVTVTFRVKLNFTDPPGAYSYTPITYSVTGVP